MGYRDKPRLREEIRSLMRNIDNAVNAPTEPQIVRLAQLREEKAEAESALNALVTGVVADINRRVGDTPHIALPSGN